MAIRTLAPVLFSLLLAGVPGSAKADEMRWLAVSRDKKGFVLNPSGCPFVPWGFNYDHDARGRLIEDYWDDEWPTVETHFAQMKKLGANIVRVHLQLGKFMDGPEEPNAKALGRLGKLLKLAEKERLYLDLTGLGCYHKKDVPAWHDQRSEKERWEVQARFWQAVAGRCAESPAVFCYDLMNEPVVPGGKRKGADWLGPPFGDKHFVQFITLDQQDRPRPDVARQWIHHLTAAIREKDKRHLLTVGLVDWSLDRPGLTSGFVPEKVADDLDFISVHLYPKRGKVDEALKTLAGFAVGKPVLVEETFPLGCSVKELEDFIDGSKDHAAGWIGFYWGKPPDELRQSNAISDALTLGWLELFERKAKVPMVHRDLAYADTKHDRQTLDVYSPSDGKNHPIVVWIHGGGWQAGDKKHVDRKPQAFVDKGLVFVSVNYRLLSDKVTIQQMAQDVAQAIRWAHDHARDYGGDPEKIVVMGHSAGAQLAALVCTDNRYLKAQRLSLTLIKGCVPVDGDTYDVPLQIQTVEQRRADIYKNKFGDADSQKDLSPVTHVAKDKHIPPFLILHVAEHPETKAQSQRLAKALQGAGVSVTVYPAEGKNHTTINADLGLPDDKPTQALFEFLFLCEVLKK
jgi:acetyl esterase/lipase